MAKKSQVRPQVVVSDVGIALQHAIEPVIKALDQFVDGVSGHELPSRKDLTLRIFLSNLCYNVHTQINGTPGKFSGIKNSYDKAQQAWSSLVDRYADRPEDLQADPNCNKFFQWMEETGAKMDVLLSLLDQFKDVYASATGEKWEPRVNLTKTAVDPNRASKMLAAVKAARAPKTEISEESTLIKAQVS